MHKRYNSRSNAISPWSSECFTLESCKSKSSDINYEISDITLEFSDIT